MQTEIREIIEAYFKSSMNPGVAHNFMIEIRDILNRKRGSNKNEAYFIVEIIKLVKSLARNYGNIQAITLLKQYNIPF